MNPSDAYKFLSSMRDTLRRLPGEKPDKKYIATFEGVTNSKQLALWRTLKDTTKIKLESYSSTIPGVKLVECAKNADLTQRLRDGRGICVEVKDEPALRKLVENYYRASKSLAPEAPKSESSSDEAGKESSNIGGPARYKDFGEAPDDNPAELNEFARKVRAGQRAFRQNQLELYEGKCAITGEAIERVLEAAHIVEHAESGINHSANGLLLRADIHLLFDKRQLRIDPDTFAVEIDRSLKGSSYWVLNGAPLRKRKDGSHPGREFLLRKWYEKQT